MCDPDELPTQSPLADGDVEATGRTVWLDQGEGVACSVHRRSRLAPGTNLDGPAVIEEDDSTTIIFASDRVEVDPSGALLIAVGGG